MKCGYLIPRKCQPECFPFTNSVSGVWMAARGLVTPPGSLTEVSMGRIQHTQEPGRKNASSLFSPIANWDLTFPSFMDKGNMPGHWQNRGLCHQQNHRHFPIGGHSQLLFCTIIWAPGYFELKQLLHSVLPKKRICDYTVVKTSLITEFQYDYFLCNPAI